MFRGIPPFRTWLQIRACVFFFFLERNTCVFDPLHYLLLRRTCGPDLGRNCKRIGGQLGRPGRRSGGSDKQMISPFNLSFRLQRAHHPLSAPGSYYMEIRTGSWMSCAPLRQRQPSVMSSPKPSAFRRCRFRSHPPGRSRRFRLISSGGSPPRLEHMHPGFVAPTNGKNFASYLTFSCARWGFGP